MNEWTEERERQTGARGEQSWVAGAVLVAIGVLLLIAQLAGSDIIHLLVLPGVGLVFLVAGLVSRRAGFMVPAGILLGLGAGVLLGTRVFTGISDEITGGIIMLGLGAGFILVMLLSTLTREGAHWWPLIPGGILSLIGGALLLGEGAASAVGRVLSLAWPLGLIALGAWFLLRVARRPRI
jgi:hypothetical protein